MGKRLRRDGIAGAARTGPVSWYVYVARCADNTLYCGISRDVADRIAEHDAGTGAKYTRGRGPLALELVRRFRTKPAALRAEYAFKQLTRGEKEALIRAAVAPWRRSVNKREAGHAGSPPVPPRDAIPLSHVAARRPR